MSKFSFVFPLLLTTLFLACKKDNNNGDGAPVDNTKKYAVKFDASGFSREVSDFGRSTAANTQRDSLKHHVSDFHYLVYDFQGNEISYKNQIASKDTSFGFITDSLGMGTYTVVMAAGETTIKVGTYYIGEPHNPMKLTFANINYMIGDLEGAEVQASFFKKFPITINGDSIVSDIELKRIVGKVEVVLEDVNASQNIQVLIEKEAVSFKFETEKCSEVINWDQRGDGHPLPFTRLSANHFERYVLNDVEPFKIFIRSIASDGHTILAERIIKDVMNVPNKKIKLTGKLFVGMANPDFSFGAIVKDQWADSIVARF